MTDNDFILATLQKGPHTNQQILHRSYAERGCGATVHCRISDLRKKGHAIRCERVGREHGRPIYLYTLMVEPEQLAFA